MSQRTKHSIPPPLYGLCSQPRPCLHWIFLSLAGQSFDSSVLIALYKTSMPMTSGDCHFHAPPLTFFWTITAFSVNCLRHSALSLVLKCSPPSCEYQGCKGMAASDATLCHGHSLTYLAVVYVEGHFLVLQTGSEVTLGREGSSNKMVSKARERASK